MNEIVVTALSGKPIDPVQLHNIIKDIPQNTRLLMAAALCADVSQKHTPRFTCSIINAKSGICSEDCRFCAQSCHYETNSPVYPLVSAKALFDRARFLSEQNIDRMGIVTSGVGPTASDLDILCETARKIRQEFPIQLCASLGVLSSNRAQQLKQAGFSSYHHNLETARSFYPTICTTHSYEVRCNTVRAAKEAGLRVCSGGLFGLGETWEQRVELSEELQKLDVDSIPINFLMPVDGTPLQTATPLQPLEGLAIIALFRLMHPQKDIVLCGGRGITLGEWDRLVFLGVANGVMVGDFLTKKGNSLGRDKALLEQINFD